MYGWVDGQLEPLGTARLPLLDAGATHGDGVFTTLPVRGGLAVLLDRHVARLADDAREIGVPGPLEARLHAAARAVMAANVDDGHADHVLRLVVTRGCADPSLAFGAAQERRATVIVTSAPLPAPADALTAVTIEGGRRPAHVKSLSWAWSTMATARAHASGADVALLVEGTDLLEAAAANVVVAVDGAALTPPADGRILPGITRGLLLEDGAVEEHLVDRATLARADEVLLLGAVRGVGAVVRLDGAPVGAAAADGTPPGTPRAPGPVEAALRARLAALVAVDAGRDAPRG